MPTFQPSPTNAFEMHYEVDDFTDPWRRPETVLMLHGNAESGLAWNGWVPTLARRYKVVRRTCAALALDADAARFRVDPRHHHRRLRAVDGQASASTGFTWSGEDRRHHRRAFAARRPERVVSLTSSARRRRCAPERPSASRIERGVRARRGRALGAPDHGRPARQRFSGRRGRMWIRFMGRTAVSTQTGFMKTIACADIRADVPNPLPDPGRHHRRQRPRLGRRDPRLAAANPELDVGGAARQLVPRRRDPCRALRRGDPGLYRQEQRRLRRARDRRPSAAAT